MLVKSDQQEEPWRDLADHDIELEADKLAKLARVEYFCSGCDGGEESMETDNGCISNDDDSHKKNIGWLFVNQDGT